MNEWHFKLTVATYVIDQEGLTVWGVGKDVSRSRTEESSGTEKAQGASRCFILAVVWLVADNNPPVYALDRENRLFLGKHSSHAPAYWALYLHFAQALSPEILRSVGEGAPRSCENARRNSIPPTMYIAVYQVTRAVEYTTCRRVRKKSR